MRIHRKQPPQAAKNIWEAHSIYTAGLGVPDRRSYRRTPLRRAERRRSRAARRHGLYLLQHRRCRNRGEGILLCRAHRRDTVAFSRSSTCRPIESKYSDSNLHWINECVAVGDRILKLFEANTNEIFTIDRSVAPKHRPSEPSSFRERRR